MKSRQIQDPVLEQISQIIHKTVSPDQIILFGSKARGDGTPESDYDILIIKDKLTNERTITNKVNHALFEENIKAAIDIVAISSESWNQLKETTGYIYKSIYKDGLVIYG